MNASLRRIFWKFICFLFTFPLASFQMIDRSALVLYKVIRFLKLRTALHVSFHVKLLSSKIFKSIPGCALHNDDADVRLQKL